MTCDDLAFTGASVVGIVALTIAAALVGLLLLVVARARRRWPVITSVGLLIAVGASVLALAPLPTAQAATGCTTSDQAGESPYTIVQTSALFGIAPGTPRAPISGTIRNNTTESRLVPSVTVSIVSITPLSGSRVGVCDASDFILLNPIMPIGQTLGAGRTISFAGASIGFNDKLVNQDACKSSRVVLHYETR